MVCLGFPFRRAVDTFLMHLFWWMDGPLGCPSLCTRTSCSTPSTQAVALSHPWPSRASVGTRQSMPLCLGIPMYLPLQACCPPDCWIISSM
ncbi:unnamed protein product [Sphagnum troendelagicum]|uniref:Secreted protein n=1 Tax=Sphagnum troendelagicum TaxID=128251 RepID=A0ABP0TT10_9BRYO